MQGLPSWNEIAVLGAIGLASVTLASALGWLRPGLFRDSPGRDLGWGVEELFVGIGIMFVGMVAAGAAARHLTPEGANADKSSAAWALKTLLLQAGMQLPTVLYMLVLAQRTRGREGLRALGVLSDRPRRDALVGAGVAVVAMGLVMGAQMVGLSLARLLHQQEPAQGHTLLTAIDNARSWPPIVLMVLSAVVLTPVMEELIFRGLVQTCLLGVLGRERRWAVVLLASTLFTAVHIGAVWPFLLPGIFVLGVVMGSLYERRGSIWSAVMVHLVFNLVNITWALLAG
ncbi:MAG: CPBP family intramembrane metalloprotease [Planctomycetes bacterium]|nr:CPBP family intramembrane metalloprotease [Planctomycetota bacterium]